MLRGPVRRKWAGRPILAARIRGDETLRVCLVSMRKTYPFLRHVLVVSTMLLSSSSSLAENPLFQSGEPLSLDLEFPLRDLQRQKKEKATFPGVLRYTDIDGNDIELDVGVSARGNSRLELCRYPPLSIKLKKKQVTGTLFAGQDKLKLVTLCRDNATYRRYLGQEYTIYKSYRLLSEYSFRARMLEVTYREPGDREPRKARPAFFIESHKEVAKRLERTRVKSEVVEISQLDVGQLSIFTLFQFMVGNTDWSVRKGPGTDLCCHNGKLVGPPDSRNDWVVLPYDFDQSGIINTRYALPNESLPIKKVRQRLYRGFCSGNTQLESTIVLFNDKRSAIEDGFSSAPYGSSRKKAALKYLRSFYEIVNDPKKKQKQLIDRCRGRRK